MIELYGTTCWNGDGDYVPVSFLFAQELHRIGAYISCGYGNLSDYAWEHFWNHLDFEIFCQGFGIEVPYTLLDILEEDEEVLLWLIQQQYIEMDISWGQLLSLMSGSPASTSLGKIEILLIGA